MAVARAESRRRDVRGAVPVIRSYAQHAEDVRLARAFRGRSQGFYVDVGAWHPVHDSVTKHFYDLGWHGIDIEPGASAAALLRRERPRDIVLEVACSDRDGEMPLHETADPNDWSTLSADIAEHVHAVLGARLRPRPIEVRRLATICEEHVRGPIDFLKVDVEGHEAAVLRGADWRRWRPSVVVVEATLPHTTRATHQEWEPALLAAGYAVAAFDGINRFYVADERAELAAVLQPPITVLDGWETHRLLAAAEHAADLERRLEDTVAELDEERRRRAEAETALRRALDGSSPDG